jgi:hypothetical protein
LLEITNYGGSGDNVRVANPAIFASMSEIIETVRLELKKLPTPSNIPDQLACVKEKNSDNIPSSVCEIP